MALPFNDTNLNGLTETFSARNATVISYNMALDGGVALSTGLTQSTRSPAANVSFDIAPA